MVGTIDLFKELLDQKSGSEQFLTDIQAVLHAEEKTYTSIQERLNDNSSSSSYFSTEPDLNKVFSVQDIRKIALKYRLRFLSTHLLVAELPHSTIQVLKKLESDSECELRGLHLLAPARAFSLKDENEDPLLFARVSDDQYLFIHKWGKDLSRFRSIQSFPLKNPLSFGLSLLALAFVLGITLPLLFLTGPLDIQSQVMMPLVMLWAIVTVVSSGVFLFFSNRCQFSSDCWNKDFS